MMSLLSLLLLTASASAPEANWYDGLPIALVTLEGPEGGLPEERLDPLLRSVEGDSLNPETIRLDLTTLFRVGGYASVKADVRPSVIALEDGALRQAVQLTYVVFPAPTISRIRVNGEKDFKSNMLASASGLRVGDPFYEGLDEDRVVRSVTLWLAAQGYTRAKVDVRTKPTRGGMDVILRVDEGKPDVLTHLGFTGNIEPLPGARSGDQPKILRRIAAREGLKVGKPIAPGAAADGQAAIRSRLASMSTRLTRRRFGWLGARVSPALLRVGPEDIHLTYHVELGPRLNIQVDGLQWGRRQAMSALNIDERLRLTRGFLEDAPARFETRLQEQGFLDAEVLVQLTDVNEDNEQTLMVLVKRGPRHRLKSGSFPDWVGIDFEGNRAIADADLMAIIDQSSPDVIRRDWYTEGELTRGVRAMRELYRARGYSQAEVTIDDIRVEPAGTGLSRTLKRWFGGLPPMHVTPRVTINEGPRTDLDTLQLEGAATSGSEEIIARARELMLEQASSPQAQELVARQLVEDHRASGYLDATARVTRQDLEGHRVKATVTVDPGDQVLLRSAVVRGAQHTRAAFLQRELNLTLGAPVTSTDLQRVKAELYALGIFQNISADLLGDGAARDLVVMVRERPRWAFEIGSGLSTDQGIRTFGRASRRNLFGRAQRLDLIGQVGLNYATEGFFDPTNLAQQFEGRAALRFTAPRFVVRSQTLVLDVLFRERREERTWQIDRTGLGGSLESTFRGQSRVRTGARLEFRQLQEIESSALLPGEVWASLLEQTEDLPTQHRAQGSLSSMLILDGRDDPVLPTQGGVLSLLGEYSPNLPWTALGGTVGSPVTASEFVKGELRLGAFLPVGQSTIHLSAQGGHAYALGRTPIPLEDRYVLGGTGSMRGFQKDTLGPRNRGERVDVDWPNSIAPVIDYLGRDDSQRWVPTGGNTMALGTLECTVPLPALGLRSWDGYSAAVFADVGNVWLVGGPSTATSQREVYQSRTPDLRVSAGLGVRVQTPIGPLQLDGAINLQSLGDGPQARFLRTEWEEAPARLHLTLGALL